MSRILIVGDLHLYYVRKNYLQFCCDIYKTHKCNQVIFIGDVVDSYGISFRTKNPDMPGPLDEYNRSLDAVQEWVRVFSKAKVCIGNHDSRIIRVANSVGISSQLLRTYKEIWGTKNWDWQWEFSIDGVRYVHGHGSGGGLYPAYNTMRKTAMSTVMGHFHSAASIKWLVNPNARLFGMDVGAGCDDKTLAFAYSQFNTIRSVMSAAVVLDGIPYLEIMPIGKNEKYSDKD